MQANPSTISVNIQKNEFLHVLFMQNPRGSCMLFRWYPHNIQLEFIHKIYLIIYLHEHNKHQLHLYVLAPTT